MEEVEVAGKKYISSKRAAKETGYTHDYLGQLCRGGQLNCKRVGKAWYISEESVTNHKKRYKREQESYLAHKQRGDTGRRFAPGTYQYASEAGPLYPNPQRGRQTTAGISEHSSSADTSLQPTESAGDSTEIHERERGEDRGATAARVGTTSSVPPSPHVADIRERADTHSRTSRVPSTPATEEQTREGHTENSRESFDLSQSRIKHSRKARQATSNARRRGGVPVRGRTITIAFIGSLVLLVVAVAGTFERTVTYTESGVVQERYMFNTASFTSLFR